MAFTIEVLVSQAMNSRNAFTQILNGITSVNLKFFPTRQQLQVDTNVPEPCILQILHLNIFNIKTLIVKKSNSMLMRAGNGKFVDFGLRMAQKQELIMEG